MKVKRILIIHPSFGMYGGDRVVLQLATGLNQVKFKPIVFLPKTGPLADHLIELGIDTQIVPMTILSRSNLRLSGLIQLVRSLISINMELLREIKRVNPDIVHINILMSLPAAIIVRLSRYSSLWHIHEIVTAPRWAAALLPWLVWVFGEKVVTNSFATRQNLVNWCPFLKNKTEVVLNGIDGSRFNNPIPMGVRKLCGWGEHTILFVMIGRIQDWKGQDIFLEAAEKAASINDSLRFLIVGDSPPGQYHFTKNMLEAIHNSTAKDSIVHWAHINDVERVLAEATASIVPSKSPEPFGLVVIEAMAAGIPVIASNHGGPSEIIKDGITGILIPPNDSDSLSKAMIKLAENVGMSNEMGRNGRIEQREKYDVSRYVSQFEELYEHQFQLS